MRRKFLRDILRVRNLSWREDSSNSDDSYTRNFLRLNLLPLIESKINSSAIEHLANFGEDMRESREREESYSRQLLDSCRDYNFSELVLIRKKLRGLSVNDCALIIREAGRNLNLKTLSRGRCNELAKLFIESKKFIFQWCDKVIITSHDGRIYFDDSREQEQKFS